MPNNIVHFAINADDVDQTKRFYEEVFGWKFQPWGPPDFFKIATSDGEQALLGALQKRRSLVPGQRFTGYECTIGVASVDAVGASVEANGGKIVMPKVAIPGVGRLIFFQDPDGNVAGAMQYDSAAG